MKKLEVRQMEQTEGGIVCAIIGGLLGGPAGAIIGSVACLVLFTATPAY